MDEPTFVRSIRSAETLGRVILGRAATFNRAYGPVVDPGVRPYYEGWRPGAFTDALRAMGNQFELRVDHRDERAGWVTFTETDEGLDFEATADGTVTGNAVLALVDGGRAKAVSLRFTSDRQRLVDGVLWRQRAQPRELSVTISSRAQYDDALVSGRRALDEASPEALAEVAARAARTHELLDRSARNLAAGAALL